MGIFNTLRVIALLGLAAGTAGAVDGWLSWRGPLQAGVSLEAGLPEKWEPKGENHLWSYDIKGGGTPVIADGKLYAFGFYGEKGEDVEEALLCLDAVSGKKLWEARFSDYISDVVYNRYAIGAPTVDAETGNVYLQTSNGRCVAYTADGKQLWERSLVEELGRLTFPNGRTGGPAVDGRLVIFHCVTANWGGTGPARDRLYAFDKVTGEQVWVSTPGIRPVDSAFSMPVFGELDGRRVCYLGTGCGNVVCVNARTGEPVWRFLLSQGGVNSQVVLNGGSQLIAIHGKENTDATRKGRLVCLNIPTKYPEGDLPVVLGKDIEAWRNDEHVAFTSSPVLVGGRVYSTIATGSLVCTDAKTGKTLWSKKLAPDQLHASPTHGDGKLYVPMFDGKFYILKPGDDGAEVLSESELGVACLGAPAIWAGKVFLMTKGGLHCFGSEKGEFKGKDPIPLEILPPGKITQLQVVPAEFALRAGDEQKFTVWGLDAEDRRVKPVEGVKWETFIPPTAKVKATVDAKFDGDTLKAGKDAKLSAGAFKASLDGMSATTRGRVVAGIGYSEDFEAVELAMKNDAGEAVNFPPLPWLGARIKWHVLELDGSKVIANRLDNVLFQRTMNFFGSAAMKDYVVEADVMTDGNRRIMSTVGLVNQRYLFTLTGNAQILEVSSNHERVKESVRFSIKPNTWYRLKTAVESKSDGSGVARAKAWPRDEDEPAEWTIEVPVRRVHPQGAPAVFAFSPQSQKRVYIDNLKVLPAK